MPVLMLEGLESRTLLSTIPMPLISHSAADDLSGGRSGINANTPSISYDPNNPQKLVMVYTSNEPDVSGTQKVFIRGKYSNNGGAVWKPAPESWAA